MPPLFSFLDNHALLSATNLTIREAARLAENPLDLRYRAIFPRTPTDSVRLSEITLVDFRPIGGRREWNAQGREIPEKLGPARQFEMVPINPTHHIDERTLQLFGESGVAELLQRGVIGSLDTWPTRLADATERQLEAEAFEAWYTGKVTVMDPKTGLTVLVSLGFNPATSYPAAGVIWSDPGQNAYNNLLAGIQAAQSKFGAVGAARMRRKVASAIIADAPQGTVGGVAIRATLSNVQERVREEGFPDFTLIVDERTYDAFPDGGSNTVSTPYVPAGLIAYSPASGVVGNTWVAPVVRAYDFLTGGNRSLANGVVIFRSEKNDGKTLMIEAQENAIALPVETLTYVENTLVV